MSRPSCSDCKHELKDWGDWPCRECSVVMPDGDNMWESVVEPTDAYPGWIPKEKPVAPLRFTNEDMERLLSNLQVDEMAVWAGKNSDYASRGANGYPFTNFDDIATDIGITPEQVLYIYMAKHLRAIRAYIIHGTLESGESLWGRIIDTRNYLAILAGMAKAKGDIQQRQGLLGDQTVLQEKG